MPGVLIVEAFGQAVIMITWNRSKDMITISLFNELQIKLDLEIPIPDCNYIRNRGNKITEYLKYKGTAKVDKKNG